MALSAGKHNHNFRSALMLLDSEHWPAGGRTALFLN
jgi:hypothetical protein